MNETDESEDEFRKRIFNLVRTTIVHCFIEDHEGHPPRIYIPDEVVRDVIIKLSEPKPPENETELIAQTKRIYRLTANRASMHKGLN